MPIGSFSGVSVTALTVVAVCSPCAFATSYRSDDRDANGNAGARCTTEATAEQQDSDCAPIDEELRHLMDLSLDDLLEVVVAAPTKIEESIEQTPGTVSVFSQQQLRLMGVRSLMDLVPHIPGCYEVAAQLGRNLALRGVHAATPQHFVVLIDGLPVRDFLTSSATPDAHDLSYAQRVEVIRGPASAIYGANALMGVINIVSQETMPEYRARVDVGDARSAAVGFAAGFGARSGAASYVSASFWRSDGTKRHLDATRDVLTVRRHQNTFDGIQAGENLSAPSPRTPIRTNAYGPSGELFLKLAAGDDLTVRVNASHIRSYLQRTYLDSLVNVRQQQQRPVYRKDRLLVDAVQILRSSNGWGELRLRPSLSYFFHAMSSQKTRVNAYERNREEGYAVIYGWRGHDLRVRHDLEYKLSVPQLGPVSDSIALVGVQVDYGVAADYAETRCYLDSDGAFPLSVYDADDPDVYCLQVGMLNEGQRVTLEGEVEDHDMGHLGDGDELGVGAFAQLSARLWKKANMVLGLRLDWHPEHGWLSSPRLSLVVPFANRFYGKFQLARAFVWPSFLYRTSNSGSHYVGQQGIRVQSITTGEALFGFRNRDMMLEIDVYYNRVRDFITFDVAHRSRTGQYMFLNQGELNVAGTEIEAQVVTWDRRAVVRFAGSYARPLPGTDDTFLVDGQLGGPTKFPTLMSSVTVTLRPATGLVLSPSVRYTGHVAHTIAREISYESIAATDGNIYSSATPDDYNTTATVVDVNLSWTPTDLLTVSLHVLNLGNAIYFVPGSVSVPHVGAGRHVFMSLTIHP